MPELPPLPADIINPTRFTEANLNAAEIRNQNERGKKLDDDELAAFPDLQEEARKDLYSEQSATMAALVEAANSLPYEQLVLYRQELDAVLEELNQTIEQVTQSQTAKIDAVIALAKQIVPPRAQKYEERREELRAIKIAEKTAGLGENKEQLIKMIERVEAAIETAAAAWPIPELINTQEYYKQTNDSDVENHEQQEDEVGAGDISYDEQTKQTIGRIHKPGGEVIVVDVSLQGEALKTIEAEEGVADDREKNVMEESVGQGAADSTEALLEAEALIPHVQEVEALTKKSKESAQIHATTQPSELGQPNAGSRGVNYSLQRATREGGPRSRDLGYSVVPPAVRVNARRSAPSYAGKATGRTPKSLIGGIPKGDAIGDGHKESLSGNGANEWLNSVKYSVEAVFKQMVEEGMLVGVSQAYDHVRRVNGTVPSFSTGQHESTQELSKELQAKGLADPALGATQKLTVRDFVMMQIMNSECIASVLPASVDHPKYSAYSQLILRSVDTAIGKCFTEHNKIGSMLKSYK
jgi:hypothetical protein